MCRERRIRFACGHSYPYMSTPCTWAAPLQRLSASHPDYSTAQDRCEAGTNLGDLPARTRGDVCHECHNEAAEAEAAARGRQWRR